MKLVYTETGKEVQVGDVVTLNPGDEVTVLDFKPPHKASSSGKVWVRSVYKEDSIHMGMEFYVGVIGAEWIEREDRS